MSRRDVEATNGSIRLAGSVWTPDDRHPSALVLMHPGSGPSDRDNDVFFPPIRDRLLSLGVAVTSFDKRGVGGSSGSWLTAGIGDQSIDLVAALEVARQVVPRVPVGLFGHSQGGWVVIEAAAPARAEFVITSSGPSVTPRVQEEYSTRTALEHAGIAKAEADEILRLYGAMWDRMRAGDDFAAVEEWMRAPGQAASFGTLAAVGAFVPDGEELWTYARLLIDHDPAPTLAEFRIPLLAVLGGADNIVPVDRSVEVFRQAVAPELLTLQIVEGGDHRMQFPNTEDFVPGYLPALSTFVSSQLGE